jgi:alkanesulfonate monooxygenase SsuD/methylene tetrahydromethanopterin reductase-like flavin-dependent oxidoreductase (luciferase family)
MQVYRAALRDAGRSVEEFPIARECYVGASHATAMDECRAALEYKYNSYAAWGMESPTASMTFEEMARDRFIIGDKVSVKEEIARWQERLGVNHFVMRVQWPGLEQEKVLNSIRRLGEIFA